MDFIDDLIDDLHRWLKIGVKKDYSIDCALRTLLFTPWGFGCKGHWEIGWWWLLIACILWICTLSTSFWVTAPLSMLHAYAIRNEV